MRRDGLVVEVEVGGEVAFAYERCKVEGGGCWYGALGAKTVPNAFIFRRGLCNYLSSTLKQLHGYLSDSY